jgi:hypothetical protein
MCASEGDCGAQASCVAGRCVAHGGVPAIATARRLLFAPVDVAYVSRGDEGHAGTPALVMLGRGDGALALLRFSVPLAPEAKVLEAYLVLERPPGVETDPTPVSLFAARVLDPWDSHSISWARQPRVQEVGAPVTEVLPASGPLVRIDIRPLVERWRRRMGGDEGIAVVAASKSATGMAIALAAWGDGHGPMLELYVK